MYQLSDSGALDTWIVGKVYVLKATGQVIIGYPGLKYQLYFLALKKSKIYGFMHFCISQDIVFAVTSNQQEKTNKLESMN